MFDDIGNLSSNILEAVLGQAASIQKINPNTINTIDVYAASDDDYNTIVGLLQNTAFKDVPVNRAASSTIFL